MPLIQSLTQPRGVQDQSESLLPAQGQGKPPGWACAVNDDSIDTTQALEQSGKDFTATHHRAPTNNGAFS